MNYLFRKQDGITLTTLIITIIIMLIVSTTLAMNVSDIFETDRLNKMYDEIERLEDSILVYYSDNKTIPEKGTYENSDSQFNGYKIIDINILDNISLKYGTRKDNG